MNDIYPIQEIRSLFPALCRLHNGNKAVYLDGPGSHKAHSLLHCSYLKQKRYRVRRSSPRLSRP